MDCRAYTELTDGLDISQPLKSGYDPYTGEWMSGVKIQLNKKQ
ncbi:MULTISPECIES: hypothetical protein [unclassified Chryseobacterium]|nr:MULTISPECIES: hypothetical protein [unclassified Chryseobacterium]